MLPAEIFKMTERGESRAALECLERYIAATGGDDEAYYVAGRLYWQLDEHGKAIASYRKALEINPDSKARHALEIASDVMDFFNPDLLNP